MATSPGKVEDRAPWAHSRRTASTTGGTWLTREEALKGTLTPSKVAGICVIKRDYFAVPDEEIKEIRVEISFGARL
jgi:predicted amidohydrolase YtcJ